MSSNGHEQFVSGDNMESAAAAMKTRYKMSVHNASVLSELRQNGDLCDAVIRCGESAAFPIHRAILSCCSPYFLALFTNGMSETHRSEIHIPGVEPDVMREIINFAYTQKCDINADNVELLLPQADQMHISGLVKQCCDFLAADLCPENAIGIRNFARVYFCEQLAAKCHSYVLENFNLVKETSTELLQLSADELVELLNDDILNVKSEETVFETVVRWINHDIANRKQHIVKLLACVRLGLLSTQYFIEKVKSHPYVKENEGCRSLVIETLRLHYDLEFNQDRDVDMSSSNPLAKPRLPHEVLFAFGGWSGTYPTGVLESYDTRADRWVLLECSDPAGPRAYHGTVALGSLIYVIGGFDSMEYFNTVRIFDPEAKQWRSAAPMNTKRCYVSVCVMDGYIYAMGGFDGTVRHNTCERYCPRTNQWTMIAPMAHQRSDACATTLNGRIYIAGGFNGTDCLNTAEVYDPVRNAWAFVSPMRSRRSGVGITAHNGYLYALGGFNGIARLDSTEKYNPATDTWSHCCNMYNPRSNFAVAVIDELIFAIGGFNGFQTIFNVECYDDQIDEWFECTNMNIVRSALSACVLSGLANVRDFIHQSRNHLALNLGGLNPVAGGGATMHSGQSAFGDPSDASDTRSEGSQQMSTGSGGALPAPSASLAAASTSQPSPSTNATVNAAPAPTPATGPQTSTSLPQQQQQPQSTQQQSQQTTSGGRASSARLFRCSFRGQQQPAEAQDRTDRVSSTGPQVPTQQQQRSAPNQNQNNPRSPLSLPLYLRTRTVPALADRESQRAGGSAHQQQPESSQQGQPPTPPQTARSHRHPNHSHLTRRNHG